MVAFGGTNYEWFYIGDSIAFSNNDTISFVPPSLGNNQYMLVASEATCSDTDSVSIYMISVNIEAGPDVSIHEGTCATLNATGGVFYSWTPIETLNDPGIANPEACPIETTTYYLTATNDSGCPATDSLTVIVIHGIPDGITPNGDNYNDVWELSMLNFYPESAVRIYNRWGEKVFESKRGDKYSTQFNGTYNGKDLPVGTYYYVIEFNDGENEPVTGPLTILR
jgi:gliding motility-associated-like protein